MCFAVFVQIRGYYDASARALQLPGHVDHKVDSDFSKPFGECPGAGADRYLLNLHRHDTFAVLLHFGRYEVEAVAVALDLQYGRLVGLLLAFALFAADMQHVGAVLPPLQMPRYGTAAKRTMQQTPVAILFCSFYCSLYSTIPFNETGVSDSIVYETMEMSYRPCRSRYT